jgi:hypothetical protein
LRLVAEQHPIDALATLQERAALPALQTLSRDTGLPLIALPREALRKHCHANPIAAHPCPFRDRLGGRSSRSGRHRRESPDRGIPPDLHRWIGQRRHRHPDPIMTVHFIGAGPGAPDLLTLRAARLFPNARSASMPDRWCPRVLAHCPPGARIVNTAPLSLDQIMEEIAAAHAAGSRCGAAAFGRPLGVVGHGRADAAAARMGVPYDVTPGVPLSPPPPPPSRRN